MTERELDSFVRRWDAYQHLSNLIDHWYWRPGWRPGRSFYTWHLTFSGQTTLHQLVMRLQRRLDLPGLDLVPLTGLHLTMQGVGFTDEVNDKDLADIIDAAHRRCATLAPFDLSLGPIDPDPEGIGLLIRPWPVVENLRGTIRDAIAAVWSSVPEPPDSFRPHVTIAYSGTNALAAPIRERIAPLRDIPAVTVTITSASLIALRREQHQYLWDTIAVTRLGT